MAIVSAQRDGIEGILFQFRGKSPLSSPLLTNPSVSRFYLGADELVFLGVSQNRIPAYPEKVAVFAKKQGDEQQDFPLDRLRQCQCAVLLRDSTEEERQQNGFREAVTLLEKRIDASWGVTFEETLKIAFYNPV